MPLPLPKPDPYGVACPRCGAVPGNHCDDLTRQVALTKATAHRGRVVAARTAQAALVYPSEGPTPVKLGTQPGLVYFHPDDTVAIGNLVRYKLHPWGLWAEWQRALVHDVVPLPFLEMM